MPEEPKEIKLDGIAILETALDAAATDVARLTRENSVMKGQIKELVDRIAEFESDPAEVEEVLS